MLCKIQCNVNRFYQRARCAKVQYMFTCCRSAISRDFALSFSCCRKLFAVCNLDLSSEISLRYLCKSALSFKTSSLLAEMITFLTRAANLRVFMDSSRELDVGLMVQTTTIFAWPDNEGCKILVSLESRYGICAVMLKDALWVHTPHYCVKSNHLFLLSVSFDITVPKVSKLHIPKWLIRQRSFLELLAWQPFVDVCAFFSSFFIACCLFRARKINQILMIKAHSINNKSYNFQNQRNQTSWEIFIASWFSALKWELGSRDVLWLPRSLLSITLKSQVSPLKIRVFGQFASTNHLENSMASAAM